jgi:hypothetical protein
MQKEDLKIALKKAGVPIYENDKISRKDLPSLTLKSTGLLVSNIDYLGMDKGIDKYTFKFRLTIEGGNCEKIQNVFSMNSKIVAEIQTFLQKKLAFVKSCNAFIKESNDQHAWVNIEIEFGLNLDSEIFEPFLHRCFEKIN